MRTTTSRHSIRSSCRLRSGEAADAVLLTSLLRAALGARPEASDETAVSVADMQLFAGGPKLRAYTNHDLLFGAPALLSSGVQPNGWINTIKFSPDAHLTVMKSRLGNDSVTAGLDASTTIYLLCWLLDANSLAL